MALSADYTDRIFYDAQGHTGNTYYYRLVRRSDGAIWDGTAETFSLTTTWSNSVHTMTETGVTGQWPVVIEKELPAGDTYNIIIYERAAATAANTDDVETEYDLRHGSIFGF